MMLAPRLPRGMMARLALVLVAALAIELAGNFALSKLQNREAASGEKIRRFAEHLATAGQVAARVEPSHRSQLMSDMAIDGMRFNWVPRTVIIDSSIARPQLAVMRARMDNAAPELAGRDLRLSLVPSDDRRHDLLGALQLGDGSFLTFRIHPFLSASPSFALIAFLHLLLVALVLGVALLMMRALLNPLGDLARAADDTGAGMRADFSIRGPNEVRRVARAFGDMQSRLLRTMEDHTHALVAVSHDLRTPIQRMRLRAGLLADNEARERMTADLIDMERFLASVTTFVQSGIEEEARLVDLAAIAMTVVDNAADAGFAIDYRGPDTLPVRLQSLALKRALSNLVDNACRHAHRVQVTLELDDIIILTVDDDGPGIPLDDRQAALLPFWRVGPREDGQQGSGLGLAIVKNAADALGATITLGDSPMGGLRARLRLPVEA